MAAGDYAFGSLALNDNVNYLVEQAPPQSPPLELQRLPFASREGSAISYVRIAENQARLRGLVKGTTFSNTEGFLDALIKQLYNGEQALKLGYQDERYWNARLQTISHTKQNGLLYAYDAQFIVADSMGFAASPSTLSDAAQLVTVSGNLRRKTLTPTPGGSGPCRPTYTITFPGAAYGTTILTVRNVSVSIPQALTITRTFGATDIVVINCDTFVVTVNGAVVDFGGQFPLLDPRAGATNSIQIDSTSTSLSTLTVQIDWRSRWLS